jgi:hypothetical protein
VTKLRDHKGQSYSHRRELDDGHRAWSLRPLGTGSRTISRASSTSRRDPRPTRCACRARLGGRNFSARACAVEIVYTC